MQLSTTPPDDGVRHGRICGTASETMNQTVKTRAEALASKD